MPSTTIARGNALSTFYVAPTLTPAAVLTYSSPAQTFNLPGLQTTDQVIVIGFNGVQTSGIVIAEADCLVAGQISIQFANITAGTLTPAAGVYTIQVVRAENLPLPATAV
jgi:hypothetical protein